MAPIFFSHSLQVVCSNKQCLHAAHTCCMLITPVKIRQPPFGKIRSQTAAVHSQDAHAEGISKHTSPQQQQQQPAPAAITNPPIAPRTAKIPPRTLSAELVVMAHTFL